MKVVWLCSVIDPRFKKLFDRQDLTSFGVWVHHLIRVFEHEPSVELHVVCPNWYNKKEDFEVKVEGVTYHFYAYDIVQDHIGLPANFHPTNLDHCRKSVLALLHRIGPDLVHIHGVDHPMYTNAVPEFCDQFPTVLTVQRFNYLAPKGSAFLQLVCYYEDILLRKLTHFGYRSGEMIDEIRKKNPSAQFYFHYYPFARPKVIKNHTEDNDTYDIAFFARIHRDKGIEDLIHMVKLLEDRGRSVTLRIFGKGDAKYLDYLHNLIRELKIAQNIQFSGFIENQSKLHREIVKARLCVLPTHYDIKPGTIIESLLMKLPVVTYDVGTMHEFNEEFDGVTLVEPHHIEKLADAVVHLLDDKELRKHKAEGAFNVADYFYSDGKVKKDVLAMYRNILSGDT